MRNLTSIYILLVIALLLPSLVACAGVVQPDAIAPLDNQVVAIRLGCTLWGIQRAIAEKYDTMIMMKGNSFLFVWSVKDTWAFAGINMDKMVHLSDFAQIGKNGNIVNAKTMGDLASYLKDNGWEVISASQLPQIVKVGITASASAQAFAKLGHSFTTFLVLPAGMFATPEQLKEYESFEGWQ